MKKKSILVTAFAVAGIAALVFVGCRKGHEDPTGEHPTKTVSEKPAEPEHPKKAEPPKKSEHPQ